MEVKIQYVVDLGEVATEVAKLLPPQCDGVENIREYLREGKVEVALSLIQDVRKEMYHRDQRLSDCQAILAGYLRVKNGRPSTPAQSNESGDNLDASLEQLKSSIAEMVQTEVIEKGGEDDSPS